MATRDVHIRLTKPGPTGALVPKARMVLQWTPTARRVDGDAVVLPSAFPVVLDTNGEATVPVEVTAATWCWEVREQGDDGITRYVAVDAGETTAEYVDLVDVDPDTLDPAEEPTAAWYAVLAALQVEDLADVDVTGIEDGFTLVWDAATETWGVGAGTGGASALADLSDVDLTDLADGDALVWDATAGTWVRTSLSGTLAAYVPTSRTVNSKSLTENITLNASDVGAAPAMGADDNYVTDAEKSALHTHPAVIAQGATQADARAAI
ncbi:hypothetical protein EOL73_05050, partial [Candidatus Saccharibacteria bacterium]|nr:hypothetical protein [Candidatus Saccharibacteria bacterium]